jgi:hypothetical protein
MRVGLAALCRGVHGNQGLHLARLHWGASVNNLEERDAGVEDAWAESLREVLRNVIQQLPSHVTLGELVDATRANPQLAPVLEVFTVQQLIDLVKDRPRSDPSTVVKLNGAVGPQERQERPQQAAGAAARRGRQSPVRPRHQRRHPPPRRRAGRRHPPAVRVGPPEDRPPRVRAAAMHRPRLRPGPPHPPPPADQGLHPRRGQRPQAPRQDHPPRHAVPAKVRTRQPPTR